MTGNRTNTVLIIGGRLQAIRKAKELGLRVVLLQHKERLLAGQAEAVDALIVVDYLDWDVARPMIQAAHEVYGFTKVISLVDQAMELVGRINDLLGLGGTSHEVARRFHNKLAMRQWLTQTGFETVRAEPVADAAAIADFGARHGYPLIVKPVDGTASRGVMRIGAVEEIGQSWSQATSLRGSEDVVFAHLYPVDSFLAEEFIDGTEYSVESFSFDGQHIVVSVTEKVSDGFVEVGHAQPACLTPSEEALITDYTVRFLTAMGLRDGVAHTEVTLSAAGPRIIESHDRVAGDRIMDLVEAVYGIDLELYAVGWPHRLVPALTERPVPHGAAATRFLTAVPGTVVAIEGDEDVRAYPGLLDLELDVKVGGKVRPLADNFDRPGQVLVVAKDTASALELSESLARKVRIITQASRL
jgi:biotin carboxylase